MFYLCLAVQQDLAQDGGLWPLRGEGVHGMRQEVFRYDHQRSPLHALPARLGPLLCQQDDAAQLYDVAMEVDALGPPLSSRAIVFPRDDAPCSAGGGKGGVGGRAEQDWGAGVGPPSTQGADPDAP